MTGVHARRLSPHGPVCWCWCDGVVAARLHLFVLLEVLDTTRAAMHAILLRPSATLSLRRCFCARAILAVPINATKQQIRARYFDLAKQTHPDLHPDAPAEDFLAIQEAFEELMSAASAPSQQQASTSASSAARGGAPKYYGPRKGGVARAGKLRPPTLGEILCQRLDDEPGAHDDVWADILSQRLEVTVDVTQSLFRACAASAGGPPAALAIFHQMAHEAMLTPEVRVCGLVSLLTICEAAGDMDTTMAVVDQITEADRTPEVLAALSSTFSCGIHG